MKKTRKWVCVLAFLILFAGVQRFLHLFTQAESSALYLEWERAAVASADGSLREFDPLSPPPALEEGEWYRFSLQMPEERETGMWLIFEAADLELSVTLDGQELWYSAAVQDPDSVNLSQAQLSLPAGGGEELTMDVRLAGEGTPDLFPPLLRLTDDPSDQAGAIAYANQYTVPANTASRILLVFWALFLIGAARGAPDWRLLLPALAVGLRMVHHSAVGYGVYFFSPQVQAVLANPWMELLPSLSMVLYLALQRQRSFWRLLGLAAAWSAGGLAVVFLLSALRTGDLLHYATQVLGIVRTGYHSLLLYWGLLWLVIVCALIAVWELIQSIAQVYGEARALSLRNNLLMANYQALERKVRESAALRHESAHRLAALDAKLQAGDLAGLEESLTAWRKANSAAAQTLFTRNITVNAILQDAASRAQRAGILFQASAPVPEELPFPDEDLCALLMNLLDNALEGAERTPAGQRRSIHFKMRLSNGFLSVLCENTFDGRLSVGADGSLYTTKEDAESHGFGLPQIRNVAKKYGSMLDIRYTASLFTVQAALQIPKAARRKTAM